MLNQLTQVQNNINQEMNVLSTGQQVNTAANNPAYYYEGQQFLAQANRLNQAVQNAQEGISLVQTGTGAMQNTSSILQQMNNLYVEAANGTLSSPQLNSLQTEWSDLSNQLTSISANTKYNNITLFTGTGLTGITLQIGSSANQTMAISFSDISANGLGLGSDNISMQAGAQQVITDVSLAISQLSSYQAQAGSVQDELSSVSTNLTEEANNMQNAYRTVTDANMASTYANFSQNQVLEQIGTSLFSTWMKNQNSTILKLIS
jgi:flagellin